MFVVVSAWHHGRRASVSYGIATMTKMMTRLTIKRLCTFRCHFQDQTIRHLSCTRTRHPHTCPVETENSPFERNPDKRNRTNPSRASCTRYRQTSRTNAFASPDQLRACLSALQRGLYDVYVSGSRYVYVALGAMSESKRLVRLAAPTYDE